MRPSIEYDRSTGSTVRCKLAICCAGTCVLETHVVRLSGPLTSVFHARLWTEVVTDGPDAFIFAITLRNEPVTRSTQEVIGIMGLNRWDTLFYMLHPDYWGAGYCTEALRAFLPALFRRQPDRPDLEASVMNQNTRSKRVLEKCGFVDCTASLRPQDQERLRLQGDADESREDSDSTLLMPPRQLTHEDEQELRRSVQGLFLMIDDRMRERTEGRSLIRFRYSRPT